MRVLRGFRCESYEESKEDIDGKYVRILRDRIHQEISSILIFPSRILNGSEISKINYWLNFVTND